MKHPTYLRIYQPVSPKTNAFTRILTHKNVDTALIAVSCAGLVSALGFLVTMS